MKKFAALVLALMLAAAVAVPSTPAHAAPSPSSGMGDFVQVTPTPTPTGNGPNVAPPNPNGPGSGSGGGGQGPTKPDGPGQGEPEKPVQPPPKQGNKPEGEDNTPIEVEVDPDIDADLKPKKAKIKKAKYIWTIRVNDTDGAESQNVPGWFANYTLTFDATKQGGDKMTGSYTGTGRLQENIDTSVFVAERPTLVRYDFALDGPLNNITFFLHSPDVDELAPLVPQDSATRAPYIPDDDALAPLVPVDGDKSTPQAKDDDQLAPLVPPTQAQASSKMFWDAKVITHLVQYADGDTAGGDSDGDFTNDLRYRMTVYSDGSVSLNFNTGLEVRELHFDGRISKLMKLVDVN